MNEDHKYIGRKIVIKNKKFWSWFYRNTYKHENIIKFKGTFNKQLYFLTSDLVLKKNKDKNIAIVKGSAKVFSLEDWKKLCKESALWVGIAKSGDYWINGTEEMITRFELIMNKKFGDK